MRARVTDPRGQEPAREPLVAHARNMARPAKLARRDELVQRFHLQAPAQLPVADPVLPLVPQLDSAHGPDALVVEHAKPVE